MKLQLIIGVITSVLPFLKSDPRKSRVRQLRRLKRDLLKSYKKEDSEDGKELGPEEAAMIKKIDETILDVLSKD